MRAHYMDNSLISPGGKRNTFCALDMSNEHLVGEIKSMMPSRLVQTPSGGLCAYHYDVESRSQGGRRGV